MRQGRRETVTVSSAEADTSQQASRGRNKPRTWELLSSYLRTHLMATLRRAAESCALYTLENAPLRRSGEHTASCNALAHLVQQLKIGRQAIVLGQTRFSDALGLDHCPT